MELMDGSLKDAIEKKEIKTEERLDLALQIVRGEPHTPTQTMKKILNIFFQKLRNFSTTRTKNHKNSFLVLMI